MTLGSQLICAAMLFLAPYLAGYLLALIGEVFKKKP